MTNKSQHAQQSWTLGFAAVLTMGMGMELLRALLPYFQFILRDRLGWSTINAGLLALAIFLCAFLAGPLNRFIGSRLLLVGASSLVGLTRLAMQLWTGDPIGDMMFAIIGVIALVIFLTTLVGIAGNLGKQATTEIAIALLGGIALDLALNGAWLSYDIVWQAGIIPLLLTVVFVVALLATLYMLLRVEKKLESADLPFLHALPWCGIGPYLFLQLLIFTNIGWAATSAQIPFAAAFFLLLLAHFLAIVLWASFPGIVHVAIPVAWLLTISLLAATLAGQEVAWITMTYLLCGQIALAGSLVAIVVYLGSNMSRQGLLGLSLAGGIGMILMVVLLFAYYAAYDLKMPFPNSVLPLVSLLLVAALSIPALRNLWRSGLEVGNRHQKIIASAVFATLIIPVVLYVVRSEPVFDTPTNGPLRVMTYNLHNGFNPQGQLDLEALARVIETEAPHVVGLQEVSRGWVLNGSVDMVTWLANRLEMVAIFGPSADPQWGNAVLTRLPVLDGEVYPLPTEDLLLRRGFIYVSLSDPAGEEFAFIDTHYHNPADGGAIRVQQSETIINFLAGRPRTIMVGDLNSEHGDREVDMLIESGLSDVLDLTGLEPGYTNPVPGPTRRIDYVLTSADWEPSAPAVSAVEASDHLPIAVTLGGGN